MWRQKQGLEQCHFKPKESKDAGNRQKLKKRVGKKQAADCPLETPAGTKPADTLNLDSRSPDCDRIHFCCFKPSSYSTLLQHPRKLFHCSAAQSCPTLCHPRDCSTPGFPVLHYLPEFAQTHVHWVDNAIQPSHPLSPPNVKRQLVEKDPDAGKDWGQEEEGTTGDEKTVGANLITRVVAGKFFLHPLLLTAPLLSLCGFRTFIRVTSATLDFLMLLPEAISSQRICSPGSPLSASHSVNTLENSWPAFGVGFAHLSPCREVRNFLIHWMANVTLKCELNWKTCLRIPCSASTD